MMYKVHKPITTQQVKLLILTMSSYDRTCTLTTKLSVKPPERTWGYVIGASFLSFSFSIVSLSSRRSSLVPTRMIGVLGQWCRTSGYHCKVIWIRKYTQHSNYGMFSPLYFGFIGLWSGLWSRYTKVPTPTPRFLKLRLLHKSSICINNGKTTKCFITTM
jgi:hypothetical protein